MNISAKFFEPTQPWRQLNQGRVRIQEKALDSRESDAARAIEQHYEQLLRSAILLTGNRAEGEDLAQETFLRALDCWNRFRGNSSRKTWLYGILLNVHKTTLRGKGRRWQRILRWFDSQAERELESPEDNMFRQEWTASLWHAVAKLAVAQQHAITLRFSEELSYAEIAEAMNCPIGTVKSRINAALKKLSEDPSIESLQSNPTRL